MPGQTQSGTAALDAAISRRWHSPENRIARLNIERREREIERDRARRRREKDRQFDAYISNPMPAKKRHGDPREALPECDDLQALADTFGADDRRTRQGLALSNCGLFVKAKRVILCGRIGKRQNCQAHDEHKFFRSYRCHGRYCETCGPMWFRKKFSDLLFALEPLVESLMHNGRHRGRNPVVAKLDFTVPNTGEMPTPEQVREFHRAHHEFWRLAERLLGVSRKEYGWAGCDEFGGSNTNLHRHSLYVGPVLPQRHKEISAIWSVANIQDRARRRELIRFARRCGVRNLWNALRPRERRFASIKRARGFQAALAHALKYPSKFLSQSEPERMADLEAAFHRTRRFSTGGAFYRLKVTREPGEENNLGSCPICGSPLAEVVESWMPRFDLEAEGRRDIEQARQQAGQRKIFSGENSS